MRIVRSFVALLLFAFSIPAGFAQPYSLGTYAYDGAGNITAIGDQTFVYDAFGRMKKASFGPGKSQEYTYDEHGNLVQVVTDGNTAAALKLAVDPRTNRLDHQPAAATHADATYDTAGNVVATETGDQFVYDGVNMVQEWRVGATRKLYLYTASDERIVTITLVDAVQQRTEWTVRDPAGKILRRFSSTPSGTWTWEEDYIYRDGQLLAAKVPGPARTLHFHLDHLGTPRLITGNGGAAIAQHTYYPFGKELTSAAQDAEPMKFTGHERDAAALDYMHARYYTPEWGRFLSVDPVLAIDRHLKKPQGWNRYSYVENRPVDARDPDGQLIDVVVDVGFIAYDLYDISRSLANGQGVSRTQGLSLAANLGAALIPGLTGAGAAVRAASKADDLAKTAVYVSRNADDVVQYVGITNSMTRRAAEHAATKGIEITSLKGFEKLSRADARAVEQTLIEIHKLSKDGGTLMNKINSIAKTNKEYAAALERGYTLLNDAGYLIK